MVGVALACGGGGHAYAHGFGQRYDLPVPLWLYLTGAGAAVGMSFVVMALFFRRPASLRSYPDADPLRSGRATARAHPVLVAALRAVALIAFVLILYAGWFGVQNPFKNVAPVMVWAIWWVGMAYVSALVGNLWALTNPLDTLFRIAEKLHARLRGGASLSRNSPYPGWLGAWPAVVLFAAFGWSELVWSDSEVPAALASAILAYAVVTWIGMGYFGRAQWLHSGEVFNRVFGLLSRFAPVEIRCGNATACKWTLRPYAVGLLNEEPVSVSEMALVILMLAMVTFDGFVETPAWAAIVARFVAAPPDTSLLAPAGAPTDTGEWLHTLALIVFPLLFLAIYLVVSWAIARLTSSGQSALQVARSFVLTLIPIAIAYQFAHYLSFLAMAVQYLIPLASDPFGYGWDLFGTANQFVRLSIVDARLLWNASVVAIVLGHVAAVYLSHAMALRLYADKRTVLRSQCPMLLLMVGYTMMSLWIMAQPIVSSRFG